MPPTPRDLAAACQTDRPNPRDRDGIRRQTDHMLGMVERAVVGYAPSSTSRSNGVPTSRGPQRE